MTRKTQDQSTDAQSNQELSTQAQSTPGQAAAGLPPAGPPPPPFPTVDIIPNAQSDTPFKNSGPGYDARRSRIRYVWTYASIRSPKKLLFQAAAQFPALFFIFKQETTTKLADITSGRASPPILWNPGSRKRPAIVNYVSAYLDFPAGNYFFMGQDDTTGTANNECSLCIRDVMAPGQPPQFAYVDSQLIEIAAPENQTPSMPITGLGGGEKEAHYLKGCFNESPGGQTVEILNEAQFKLWQLKKSYFASFTFARHFFTQPFYTAAGSKWYLLLKNPGVNPFTSTNNPVSLTCVLERWRRP